jgi:cyanate permease
VAIGVDLFIAFRATSWVQLAAALAVCGFVNAGNQTAVNLALTQAQVPRLGLAIALKQSGMPTAAMLSGLMVPVIALTLGWRWAYVVGVVFAVAAIALVLMVIAPVVVGVTEVTTRPVSTRHDLVVAAAVGGFLSFGAGSLNAWTVGSGVDAGLSEATAGWLLSLGAALGIALRVFAGSKLDATARRPFLIAGLMVLVGAAGVAFMSIRLPGLHIAATLVAFAGGWVWPVFTNYGIVRTNAEAAGAVTGITQSGVYVGVFIAPLLTGWLIEAYGYTTMWFVVAASLTIGSALALSVRHRF